MSKDTPGQLSMFDFREQMHGPAKITPHYADQADVPRLTGQNAAILARLRQGPATNRELAEISLKYTSRISDVRAWLENHGESIICKRGCGGLNMYRIVQVAERNDDDNQ